MSLRDIQVRNAKPKAKPYKLFDGGGLYLEVTPSGGKAWRYKYRFAGKERRLSFGLYPDVTLADARERHAAARKALSAGQDPGEIKRESKRQAILRSANTFEMVAREWHQSRLHTWTPKHGAKLLKRLVADAFPKLGHRPVAEINAAELLAVVKKVEGRGALDVAHRLLQNCGQVFTYAIVTQRAERNPASDLRGALKPIPKRNHAYLKPEELPDYFKKLNASKASALTKLGLNMVLLTFVRSVELRAAEWTEIHWEKGEWRIPAERMKMREIHIVPLAQQTLKLLHELQKVTGSERYLFPNKYHRTGFMSENTLLFALYDMDYRFKATVHGFRSTASTVLNEQGFRQDIIERQLAHGERNEVRAAYNHAQYLPERRKMMQWWADYLDAVTAKKPVPPMP